MKVSRVSEMGFRFDRASPALKAILLGMRKSVRPSEVDHCMFEFGSVEYRIQSSISDPYNAYLSLRMTVVRCGSRLEAELSEFVKNMTKKCRSKVCEIIEPAKEGYEITMMIHLSKIPQKRELQIISKIASVPALALSSELKELLCVNHQSVTQRGNCKPLKLTYHPSQSFFVLRQPCKTLVVFPMRFKDESDVHIAMPFFQELTEEGRSNKWAKVPQCHWSPIPPPDLRGELIDDLNTNAGFISFDISLRHLEGKNVDNITWSLLRFHTYVTYHIKSSKCFIQRKMKMQMENLLQVLHETENQEDIYVQEFCSESKSVRKLPKFHKSIKLGKKGGAFVKSIKKLHFPVKIRALNCFRWRCARIQKEVQAKRYIRLH